MRLGIELGFYLVTWIAGAGHSRRSLLGVRASALTHEALDDAVKRGAVVEPFLRQLLEILHGLGRDVRPEGDRHVTVGGFDHSLFVGGSRVAHGNETANAVAPRSQEPICGTS